MPAKSREVKVLITGDASKLDSALRNVETRIGGFKRIMGGALAGVGVAAIGRGVLRVANQFEDTALAANNFATASGLSVEQASRWNEVAGDFKIESDKVSGAMLKMSKNMSKDVHKWEDYGIAVAQAEDGSVDLNKTFINTLDQLGKISDPLERAQVGSELFGRSWQDLAPLIELGADGMTDALNSVGDAQVINEDEVRKADEFREKMDNLNDSVDTLKLGLAEGLIPAISTLAGWVADLDPKMVTWGITIAGVALAVGKISTAVSGALGMLDLLKAHPVFVATAVLVAAIVLIATHWDQVTAAIQRTIDKMHELSNQTFGPVGDLIDKIPGVSFGRAQPTTQLTAAGLAFKNSRGKATGGNAWSPFLAGEHGPELIWPRAAGAYVSNASETAGLMGGTGGPLMAVDNMYVNGQDDVIRLERMLDRQRRRDERSRGKVRV